MKAWIRGAVAVFVIGLVSQPLQAEPLQEGAAAFARGDYATALRLLRPLAEQGDAYAQAELGFMYAKGRGVAQDYGQAAQWFRKAADKGDAFAQANLGLLYATGQGVARDYAAAASWYRKAAEKAMLSRRAASVFFMRPAKVWLRILRKPHPGIARRP